MFLGTLLSVVVFVQSREGLDKADDWASADEQILRDSKVGTDGPAVLRFLQQLSPDPQRLKDMQADVDRLGHESFVERRRAFERLASYGFAATSLLKQSATSSDPEIARSSQVLLSKLDNVPNDALYRAAVRTLGRQPPAGAFDWLVTQLPAVDSLPTMEAFVWSLHAMAKRDPALVPKLETLIGDPQPTRRSAAALALVLLQPDSPKVRALLGDKVPTVRWHVAMQLARVAKDRSAIPVLIDLLPLLSASEQNAIDELFRHLAGKSAPDVSLGTQEQQNERLRDAWRTWWQQNQSTVDLKRLDEQAEELGYTLVLQVGFGHTMGEAVEYAADGKTPRWSVGNLNLPIDVQFLPRKKRVLIAEYSGHQVTERELSGEIRERWAIPQPIMCQRLPNGHTLIASRNQLVEFGPQQRKVFTLARPTGDIAAAGRTEGGVYVLITRDGTCEQFNSEGQKIKSFPVARPYQYSSMELLPNNRMVMTHMNGLAEYDLATGKQTWMIAGHRTLTSVQRLKAGTYLVSSTSARRIMELDTEGKVIKEIVLENQIPWRAKRR